MALIKCKKCGKEISDKATKCVHCGTKVSKINSKNKLEKEEKKVNKKVIIILCIFIITIVIGGIYYFLIKKTSIIGNWEHTILYKDSSNNQIDEQYSKLIFNDDNTFTYHSKIKSTGETNDWSGTYNKVNNNVYLNFKYEQENYTLTGYLRKDNTLCLKSENCDDYFFKESYKGNKNIEYKTESNTLSNFTNVSLSDIENIKSSSQNSVIYLFADYCTYCKNLTPTLTQIKNDLNINIYSLDYGSLSDNEKEQIEKILGFKINGIPAVVIIGNNKIIDYHEGNADYGTYYEFIKNGLGV